MSMKGLFLFLSDIGQPIVDIHMNIRSEQIDEVRR